MAIRFSNGAVTTILTGDLAKRMEDRVRRAAGLSSYKLVGTPEHIAEQLIVIHRAGFIGTTLSFVNFKDELPFFIERVMPLLRQAGIIGAAS